MAPSALNISVQTILFDVIFMALLDLKKLVLDPD